MMKFSPKLMGVVLLIGVATGLGCYCAIILSDRAAEHEGEVIGAGPTKPPGDAPKPTGSGADAGPARVRPSDVPRERWTTSRLAIVAPTGPDANGGGVPSTAVLRAAEEPGDCIHSAQGLMAREIVRQALLIAARDGLGLATRDATLREEVDPGTGREVAELASHFTFVTALVTIRVPGAAQPEVVVDLDLPPRAMIDLVRLVERIEPHIRKEFVSALKSVGVTGTPGPAKSDARVPEPVEEDLGQLTFPAQFAAVRDLHDAIRRDGESPQLLGALVRGYAQLGVLAEFHLAPAHEAYKARALLYAQHLATSDPGSPWGPWHKAFAEALAGLPGAAQADLKEADRRAEALRSGGGPAGPARPEWADVIAAFSRHDRAALARAAGDRTAPLAALLGFLDVENSNAVALIVETGRAALEVDPECFRISDAVCEHGGVGVQHWATEYGPEVLTRSLPGRLGDLSGLPAAAKDPLARGEEPAVTRALVDAGAPGADLGEPSWAVLGWMIRETRLVQTWRRLRFMRVMWSVPVDDYLAEARPLVADHPYRDFIETYGLDPQRQRPAVAALMRKVTFRDPEGTWETLRQELRRIGIDNLRDVYRRGSCHQDATAHDLAKDFARPQAAGDINVVRRLLDVDPDSPVAAALLVRSDWKVVEKDAASWGEKYAQHPAVLKELAARFAGLGRREDAERFYREYLRLSPDREAYEALADLERARGDAAGWRATLDEALGKPDYGLDHMMIRVKIASQLIREEKWKEARPYAEDAAESWAARGIDCALLCYEGLEEWDKAEEWMRRLVERYPMHYWKDWLLWCARTGHGDVRSAERAAAGIVASLGEPQAAEDLHSIGLYFIWTGKPLKAVAYLGRAFDQTADPFEAILVAVLADEVKDAALREKALDRIEARRMPPALVHLLGVVRPVLAGKVKDPDLAAIDADLAGLQAQWQGPASWVVARVLASHGHPDQADRYLERCAKNRETNAWLRALAIRAVRQRGLKLGADDLAPRDPPR